MGSQSALCTYSWLARGPVERVIAGKEHGAGYDSSREQVAAAKVGRAMELPSPVASLIPSLVLNTVVTFGSLSYRLAAIPFRRVPVLRGWGRLWLARSG